MRAAFIEKTGSPDEIQVGDLPTPKPGPGQVLVKVGASALNPIDLYIRSGLVAMPMAFPYIIGCDLAGTVAHADPGSKRFRVGDRVWGSNQGLLGRQGVTAEFAAVDEDWCYPTPAKLSDPEAAALAMVGITAHLGLFRSGRLQSGETVYVPGGSGGVGSMVVQMAKAAGRPRGHLGREPREGRILQVAGRGPRAQLQDRRHPRTTPRVRPRGHRPLVRNPARTEPRGLHPPAPQARPDDPDGRPGRQAGLTARLVLSPRLLAARLRHVQRHGRRTATVRRRHQSLDRIRPVEGRSSDVSSPWTRRPRPNVSSNRTPWKKPEHCPEKW